MALDITSYEIGKKSAGGSGTTDYTELSNKPSINDVTLSGNNTSSDLKLQSEIDSSHKLNADLVDDTSSTNKFVTSTEKTTWNGKQDVMQYSTVPTAGADTVGKIIQYTGTTDSNYTNGYFYKGISTTEGNETTYSWSNVGVQDLSGKQNVLTFDSTPTENSNNPVTSNGIFQALAGAGGGTNVTVFEDRQSSFNLYNQEPGEYYFKGGTTYGGEFRIYKEAGDYWGLRDIYSNIIKIVILKKYNSKSDFDKTETFGYMIRSNDNNGQRQYNSLIIDYFYNQRSWSSGEYYNSIQMGTTNILNGMAGKDYNNSFSGTNTFNSHLPTSTLTPTQDTELVPKSYVDAQIQALRTELSGE